MIKTTDTTGKILFEEQQQFPQWLILLMILPVVTSIAAIVATGVYKNGDVISLMALIFVVLLQLAIMYYFKISKFEKIVTESGLYFRWKPLQKRYRFISRSDIDGFQMRRGPFLKLGRGWLPWLGRYHNLSSGNGIQVFHSNGKRIFFGTGEGIFFYRAMEQIAQPMAPVLSDI